VRISVKDKYGSGTSTLFADINNTKLYRNNTQYGDAYDVLTFLSASGYTYKATLAMAPIKINFNKNWCYLSGSDNYSYVSGTNRDNRHIGINCVGNLANYGWFITTPNGDWVDFIQDWYTSTSAAITGTYNIYGLATNKNHNTSEWGTIGGYGGENNSDRYWYNGITDRKLGIIARYRKTNGTISIHSKGINLETTGNTTINDSSTGSSITITITQDGINNNYFNYSMKGGSTLDYCDILLYISSDDHIYFITPTEIKTLI
jgi:hypothetical protein